MDSSDTIQIGANGKLNAKFESNESITQVAESGLDFELDTLIHQIEFVRQLSQCTSHEAFEQQILTTLQTFGFSDYAFMLISDNGHFDTPFCTRASRRSSRAVVPTTKS